MNNQRISWDIKINGTLLSMPSELHMGVQDGQFELQGTLQTNQMNLTKVLGLIDSEVAEKYGTYLSSVTGLFPEQTYFKYRKNQCTIWIGEEESRFAIMWQEKDIAVLYAITVTNNSTKGSIEYYLSLVAKELGMQQMFLLFRKGNACTMDNLTDLVMGQKETFVIPTKLSTYNLLFCGLFAFDKETVIGQAMKLLFGVKEMQMKMFLAASEQGIAGYVMLPVIESTVLKVEELYFGIEVNKKTVRMMLSGTFEFAFIKDVLFCVECALSNQGFRIEAFAKMENPKPLFHTFSLGDTCLVIGYEKGFIFQMFCNLYMGKIKIFGALGLTVVGNVANIDLLSAAVTDITLPIFVESVLGKKIDGLETFDFIQLLGLPFSQIQDFPVEKNMSKEQAAEAFNSRISDKSFLLDSNQMQVETFENGTILIDKKRMRHYYITEKGKLQLQAQFYYALKDMKLGDYNISKGIFVCCTIKLFQKVEIQALFSMSDTDGVLAYACIRNLDLGFLKLSASGLNTASDNPLANLPEKSLLRQFVSLEEKGAVFYLRAGSTEVSFYIDAKLELLGLFKFATRILYVKGLISIDVRFSIFAGIEASLHIGVAYQDFSKGSFSFMLEIDCTGLEKKLKQVQDKINAAIENLKNKINSAKKKITEAQNNVNELYGQISKLDRKIQDCKSAIKNAKWYKKAFVAIAKGIEIAAYEVAKAGLYAAIGVAKAALEVAKQVVALGGIIGEGVLRAIDGAITAALNLFFIRLIRLESNVSLTEQYFQAEIEFVALGKTYHYQTKLGRKAIAENPSQALSSNINGTMDSDLKNIEKGTFKSNRNRYRHEEYTIAQHKSRLQDGMEQLEASTRLMCRMQQVYVEGCGEAMPEFEEINVAYQQSINGVAGMLDIANRSVNFEDMNKAVSILEEEMKEKKETVRDTTYVPVKSAIADYKESMGLLEMIQKGIVQVEDQSNSVKEHVDLMKQKEEQYQKEFIKTGNRPDCDMVSVLNTTEEIMYEEFPVTRNKKDFINLSREKLIHQYLDEARGEFNGEQTEKIKTMRTRAAKGRYESRL